jgi:radical SAM protein with 4Fe4S-binding SPASM domain
LSVECIHLPEKTIGAYGAEIKRKLRQQRVPIAGSIEVTARCNLRCAHCYMGHDGPADGMSTAQVMGLIDEVVASGCLWLTITGGEPLMRKDLPEIYLYAKQKGLLITLFTNATLITPQFADLLAEWPPVSVEVSLYGMTAETYEMVTGVTGSHERCIHGIELLDQRGISLTLKTMAMTLNRHELEDMQSYAEDLDARFRFDVAIRPLLNGDTTPCKLRLPVEEVIRLDLADEDRAAELYEMGRTRLGKPSSNKLYGCGAGLTSFYIDAQGRLQICTLARHPGYDLLGGSFEEGWRRAVPALRAIEIQCMDLPCLACSYAVFCGRCPAWAELENGDPETVVEYACQIAHRRARVFATEA